MRFVTTSKDPSYNGTTKPRYFDLDFVDNFNYLGSYFATTENDVKKRQGQAWGAFWRLERIWNFNLPIAIKVCLYKCTVLSFLLYGSET